MNRVVGDPRRRSGRRWRSIAAALVVAAVGMALVAACSNSESGDQAGVTPTTIRSDDDPASDDPASGDSTSGDSTSDDPAEPPDDDRTALDATVPPADDPPVCELATPTTSTTVTVWHSLGGTQTVEAIDEIVDAFVAVHPEIDIEIVATQGYDNALRLFRDTPPDELPDLFMTSIDSARLLAESGGFVPPQVCSGESPAVLDDLLPVIRGTLTIDDVLWAYPFNVSTPVLVYDPSLLAELDLELDPDGPPVGLDELRDIAAALAESELAPGGLVLYDRSASWLVEQWAVHHDHVLVEPDNGRRGHPVDGVRFATDEAVAALEWARDLHDDELVSWVGLNQSGIDDLLKLIDLSDRAAFTMHTSASIGELVELVYGGGLADLDGAELGVAPIPSPVATEGSLVGGGALWLRDGGDPVAVGAAALLAEHVMGPASQATFAAATGYVPATVSAAEHPVTVARWEEFPQFGVGYRQLAGQGASPSETGMQIGPRVVVQRVLEAAAADVIVNGADARSRLGAAEDEALELIRRYELDGTEE